MTIALDGVVSLVTGATGGMGREICKAMKAAGATVIATDIASEASDVECDLYLPLDVTNEAGWQTVADEVQKRWDRLDSLVHVAGVALIEPFESTSLAAFHRVNAVNVDGIIVGTQVLLPLLKAGGKARESGASIVNFSSVGGLRGAPFNAAYCTSKAAVTMLSKCLGAEFAALKYNIRVNSLHPGGIETDMMNAIVDRFVELRALPDRATGIAGAAARHPIGRTGRPQEIAGGVVYLCSDAASFVTCSEFLIDGGYSQV